MKITEKTCKTLMGKTEFPADYCINPYTGCQHSCRYCYAHYMQEYTNHNERWGEFVDVKINAVDVLKKEVLKKKKGRVCLSTVTDAYQPIEKEYRLTRKILEVLAEHGFSITINTKSALVLRDLDILKNIKDAKVGFSITTTKESVQKAFEPLASTPEERFRAISILKQHGISTFVMIAPILPGLTDVNNIMRYLNNSVDFTFKDGLNIGKCNRDNILMAIRKFYPDLLPYYMAKC